MVTRKQTVLEVVVEKYEMKKAPPIHLSLKLDTERFQRLGIPQGITVRWQRVSECGGITTGAWLSGTSFSATTEMNLKAPTQIRRTLKYVLSTTEAGIFYDINNNESIAVEAEATWVECTEFG